MFKDKHKLFLAMLLAVVTLSVIMMIKDGEWNSIFTIVGIFAIEKMLERTKK
jgi:hypothetical protein